jgi:hypothetical protein
MSTFDVNENSLGHDIYGFKFPVDLNKSHGKLNLSNIEQLLSTYLKQTNIHIVGYFTSEVMYACDMYVEIYSMVLHLIYMNMFHDYKCKSCTCLYTYGEA